MLRNLRLVAGLALACVLAACSLFGPTTTNGQPDSPALTAYKYGCSSVAYAHDAFIAVSPALIATGKLSLDSATKEAAIFAAATSDCAQPPADPAAAGIALLAKASAITLLLTVPAS